MAMDKEHALVSAVFGSRVAEDEVESLGDYFVETEQWRKLFSGAVDVVFGSKGAGKSALYSLLVSKKDVLRLGRRTVFIPAENPRGTPAFRDLVPNAPASEEEFRGLWKLYFLSLSANYLRNHLQVSKIGNAKAASVINSLVKNGLLAPNISLLTRLNSVIEYIRKHAPVFEGAVTEPNTGVVLTGKITLKEPNADQRANGFESVDDLFDTLDLAFREVNIRIWLVLDRLDVAFSDSPILEGNALRSLFRTYLDLLKLSHIDLKIFLRDDIWNKIVAEGFREASHVVRTMQISWDNQSLLNLIVRRLVHNDEICSFYGVDRNQVLNNVDLQKEFFYRVFPLQVEVAQNKPSTFDWMISRTADGTKRTAPRELIHLLIETRDEQLKLYDLGNSSPLEDNLFSKAAITQALPEVSRVRYRQTLCAEYPDLKKYIDSLERQKAHQVPKSLARLWKCTEAEATDIAGQLSEIGFFERRGTKDFPTFWVPFLYRDALSLIQGTA